MTLFGDPGSLVDELDSVWVTGKPNVEFRRILRTGMPKDDHCDFESTGKPKVLNFGML